MREELDKNACAMAVAPLSPILLEDRSNVVREELNESACAMAVAPLSPILLEDRFNVVSVRSLRARRRS